VSEDDAEAYRLLAIKKAGYYEDWATDLANSRARPGPFSEMENIDLSRLLDQDNTYCYLGFRYNS
jgi:hypothetical protein